MEIFTHAHWRARGLSERALRRALESGAVWRVLKSVYADVSVPDCLETRARAIALIRPRETAVGRQTAAWLSGLDVLPPGRSVVDEPIRLIVAPDVTPPRLPGCRSYQAPLPESDMVEQHGVTRTTDLRTALDLGRFCQREQAVASLDAFLHSGRVSLIELWQRASMLVRVRNCRILRANLSDADAGAESYAESVLRVVYVDGGLPRPETQIAVSDRSGALIGFLDLGWLRYRVGAEYDGEEGHDTDEQREHDERRRATMRREDDWVVAVARKSELWGHRAALVKRTAELLLEAGWSPDDATILEQIVRADEFEARTGQRWQWMPVKGGRVA
ncbi:MAG TPA: hypothetical protein VEX15_22730 [Nocardioidaceae bacterium]|nr:hypothetical protein [Nocardioidaceae bacterium]